MLLDAGALQAPQAGAYRVWAGRPGGLREETANLARLAAGLVAGATHAVTLLPAQEAGARWAGDPLQPSAPDEAGPAPGELELLTSGTTGVPKRVRRRPAARASARAEPGAVWLLAYAPQRWAGLSVLLHAVATGARVAVPSTLESGALVQEAPGRGRHPRLAHAVDAAQAAGAGGARAAGRPATAPGSPSAARRRRRACSTPRPSCGPAPASRTCSPPRDGRPVRRLGRARGLPRGAAAARRAHALGGRRAARGRPADG